MKLLKDISNRRWYLLIMGLAIFVLAWAEQSSVIFSWDVSWLSEASRRLLLGGSYTNNFFENNPPLILYLYVPAVLLSKWLHINIMFSMRLYIYLIASISLYLCYLQAKQIFSAKSDFIATNIIWVLLGLYVLLPFYENGQREHLFIMLTMPYYFLIVLRLDNQPINKRIATVIGICAGLGIFIKPVFMVIPLLLEGYYAIKKRSLFAFARVETISIMMVLAVYMLILLEQHMDYITIVLPYVTRWCYANISLPWEARVINVYIMWPITTALLSLALIKYDSHKNFLTTLIIATIGSILIFILQGSNWYYRMLPMVSLSILLLTYLFFSQIALIKTKHIYLVMGFFIFLTFLQLYLLSSVLWTTSVLYPLTYITYCACLLAIFHLALPKDKFTFFKLAITLLTVFLIMAELSQTIWASNQFYIATLSMLFLFAFFINQYQPQKIQYTISLFFMFVFCLPLYQTLNTVYQLGKTNKASVVNLAHYLDENAINKSIYVLSTNLRYVSALNYSQHTSSASRFSHLIGLGGMATHMDIAAKDKQFLTQMIIEDLIEHKPDFVLVDVRKDKHAISYYQMINHQATVHYIPFDYIAYFSEDKQFKKIWQTYRYKETIESMQLAVYQRSDKTIDKNEKYKAAK